MSARQEILDALDGLQLPIVEDRWPEQITGPTLVLGVEEIEPAGIARMRKWTFMLAVLTQLQAAGVEAALEETLAAVLGALDAASKPTWTKAVRRNVKDDAYHAIVVTVTITTQEV